MDIPFNELSDDGHFLSDTDDEYNEDFEEWDKLGSADNRKESDLSKLNESELMRLASVNAEAAHKATPTNNAEGAQCAVGEGDKELEQNRRAWLSMKNPMVGRRQGKKTNNLDTKTPKKKKSKDVVPKTEEELKLESLAFEEIMRETKRGKERAEEMGSSGWQKPKVPPTNKRFLRNTLLSTLPRKRRRDDTNTKEDANYSEETTDENSDVDEDEGIKADVKEKIDDFRKQRSQNYEEEKHHRKQKQEEKKIFNKAMKEAEREKRRADRQTEMEKKKFDNVMRYGVKIGAKREKVTQEKKKAIFDRYHGVWMPLDRTYGRSNTDSESDEGEGHSSSGHRGYERGSRYDRGHKYHRGRGRGYSHQSMDRQKAWQAYYTAAAYSYYKYMHEQNSGEKYREHHGHYRDEPGSSKDQSYKYFEDKYHSGSDIDHPRSSGHHYDRNRYYEHNRDYRDGDDNYKEQYKYHERTGDYRDDYHDEKTIGRENSDSDVSQKKKHKKHKKHKKSKKSKKKHKKSSKKYDDSDNSDSNDSKRKAQRSGDIWKNESDSYSSTDEDKRSQKTKHKNNK